MPENEGILKSVGGAIASAFQALTRDGTLAAAWRQGADELGEALKAFPDSIAVYEPGTILNPTQGEIAAAREQPTPSEIARDSRAYEPEPQHTQDHGMER